MIGLLQRVSQAEVQVAGRCVGRIAAGLLVLVGRALVVRENLGIGHAVRPITVEVRVEPIHELVHLRPLLQILRVGRRIDLVSVNVRAYNTKRTPVCPNHSPIAQW